MDRILKSFVQKHFTFSCLPKIKRQRIYQIIVKEGNDDHKYLWRPDLRYNNFEILRSAILLDNIDMVCAETVKYKPTGNYSGLINYSNIIYFLVNDWITVNQFFKGTEFLMFQKFGKNRKKIKVNNIGAKDNILLV